MCLLPPLRTNLSCEFRLFRSYCFQSFWFILFIYLIEHTFLRGFVLKPNAVSVRWRRRLLPVFNTSTAPAVMAATHNTGRRWKAVQKASNSQPIRRRPGHHVFGAASAFSKHIISRTPPCRATIVSGHLRWTGLFLLSSPPFCFCFVKKKKNSAYFHKLTNMFNSNFLREFDDDSFMSWVTYS